MVSRRDRRPEALPLDEGVLTDDAVCEFQSDLAVEARGGTAVLPWRDRYLSAEARGLHAVASAEGLADAGFRQAVVHLQKSRAATCADLAEAWRLLVPGGRLLLTGSNALGISSAVKRLARELGQSPVVVANRARARVARFQRDDGPGPETEALPTLHVELDAPSGERLALDLESAPGVFSARRLDAGSEVLLGALASLPGRRPPRRIVDLGCGTGVLGLAAARLWPEARVLLADADARAVACATANARRLGLTARCAVAWWDAREAPPDSDFDLALVNPPFHRGGATTAVDLGPALALFESLQRWLRRGGRALLVANRTLPYEEPLARIGELEILETTRGYKLLSLKRSARSAGSRGRQAPGSRSAGRSRPPTRSR